MMPVVAAVVPAVMVMVAEGETQADAEAERSRVAPAVVRVAIVRSIVRSVRVAVEVGITAVPRAGALGLLHFWLDLGSLAVGTTVIVLIER
jgi:hypothetical protein